MRWPPEVEVVAAVFRTAGAEARLEQLPEGETEPPGLAVRTLAYECRGKPVVVLVPEDRDLDARKLVSVTECASPRPTVAPAFPYPQAAVFVERLLLAERTVWLRAGSPRFVVAISPAQLTRLTTARPADLVAEV